MSVVLVLWLMFGLLANLPTAFSRPRRLKDGSGVEADELWSAKRQSLSGCGQVVNNTLTSPNYPSNYPNGMDCVYRLSIPVGKSMLISFIAFDLENGGASCSWDYLKITNENNYVFGKYCGSQAGVNVVVTGIEAVITFHSDSSVTRPGYKLTFNVFSNGTQAPPSTHPTAPGSTTYPPWFTTSPPNGGCGYVQNNQLLSPGYPNYYPHNMDCTYWIHIPHGKALRIDFDIFEVDDCGFDYLKITNENNQTFGQFCGDQQGHSVTVTGRYAVITFHSDSSVNDQGYRIYISDILHGNVSTSAPYTTYPPYNYTTSPPWYTTAPPNPSCGYVHYNQLTSPGYPNNYPNNMHCNYWIYIPYGKALRIYFDVFYMNDCGFDYLRITNENNQTFGTFCGSKSGHVVIVTGYYARLTFHSDSSLNDRGYKLFFSDFSQGNVSTSAPYTTYPPYNYTTSPPWYTTAPPNSSCGYVQYNQLTSPGYPNNYPNNMDCNYWIYIPYGKALRIYFDVFYMNDCGYDYLRIANENNQTFGTFCGSKSGHVVIVTGYYARLTFHSDSSLNDRGYKLFFSDVSQGNASTSAPWPYTTYPPYTSHPSYFPTMDPRSKLLYYINISRILLNEMEKVVNNELPSNGSCSSYKGRVKRALSDVQAAMTSEGRQKRDVKTTLMIGQLEKRAADLMKKLDTKEAEYKRRVLLKKKLAERAPKRVY